VLSVDSVDDSAVCTPGGSVSAAVPGEAVWHQPKDQEPTTDKSNGCAAGLRRAVQRCAKAAWPRTPFAQHHLAELGRLLVDCGRQGGRTTLDVLGKQLLTRRDLASHNPAGTH
jgi:hypothetical protein